jgi:hypothetical protein
MQVTGMTGIASSGWKNLPQPPKCDRYIILADNDLDGGAESLARHLLALYPDSEVRIVDTLEVPAMVADREHHGRSMSVLVVFALPLQWPGDHGSLRHFRDLARIEVVAEQVLGVMLSMAGEQVAPDAVRVLPPFLRRPSLLSLAGKLFRR